MDRDVEAITLPFARIVVSKYAPEGQIIVIPAGKVKTLRSLLASYMQEHELELDCARNADDGSVRYTVKFVVRTRNAR
jgi:hypothetical protein